MSHANAMVRQILETPFPSYHPILELAGALNRSGDEVKRAMALALLEGLRRRYLHVLAIGQEYVLALIQDGDHDRAEIALKSLEHTFANLDEETLCRWGRMFKDRGDDYLDLPGALTDRHPLNRARAVEFYRKALEKYGQAYRAPWGYYPGINKATMLVIIGSLKAEQNGQAPGAPAPRELLESVDLAGELLASRRSWKADQPDDATVWHPATEAEARLLIREWAQAADLYREALGSRRITHFARESMRRQVDRILLAFRKLGIAIPPPFDDTASFFATGSATAPGKAGPPAGASGPSGPGPNPMPATGPGDPTKADTSPREPGAG